MEHNRQNFLSFWTIFCTFTHSWPKKSKFCKNEKKYRDIIILHMCTINDNHTMYGSWNMEQDGHNFFSFWTIFCPFTLLTTSKIKIENVKKMPGDIIIWHIYAINDNHMMYGSWDTEHNRIFCHFGLSFALLPP